MGDGQVSTQTFNDHVNALRKRIMYPALLFIAGGSLAYFFYPQIIRFVRGSLNQPLYYQTPAGNFTLIMKICVLCGLALAIPALTYNIIRFIEPAFTKRIKRSSVLLVSLLALVLAIGGAAFAMYVIVPMSLHFFMSFNIEGIKPLLSANEYLNFVLTAIMSSMIMFQIPLVVLFIDFVHPIPPSKFLKFEKWVIVGSVALALVLPFTYDPITQFVVALPIIALYNFSILIVTFNHFRRKRAAKKQFIATQRIVEQPVAIEASEEVIAPAFEPPKLRPAALISDMRPMTTRSVMAVSVPEKVLTQEVKPSVAQQFSHISPKKAFDVFS